eukprot:UN06003
MLGILAIFASYIRKEYDHVSKNEATSLLSTINIVGTVFRLGVGVTADTIGTKVLFSIALLGQCIIFAFYT